MDGGTNSMAKKMKDKVKIEWLTTPLQWVEIKHIDPNKVEKVIVVYQDSSRIEYDYGSGKLTFDFPKRKSLWTSKN
jgi:hypothetical protein